MEQDEKVYQRIINTLHQLNGRDSILQEIKTMREQIDDLQNQTSLKLSLVSNTRLNYRVKDPLAEQSSIHILPGFTQSDEHRTDYDLSQQQSTARKSARPRSQFGVSRGRTAQRSASRSVSRQKSSKKAVRAQPRAKAAFMNFVYVPYNKLYNSTFLEVRAGSKVVLEKEFKVRQKNSNKEKIANGVVYLFDRAFIEHCQLFKAMLQKPAASTVFIGPKHTGKKKMCIEWFEAQVCGLIQLAKLKSYRKQSCSVQLMYYEYYSGGRELQKNLLFKQCSVLEEGDSVQQFAEEVRHIAGMVTSLANNKSAKKGSFRTRRIDLLFRDGQGDVRQSIMTHNGIDPVRGEVKPFQVAGEYYAVWCLNPLFKHFSSCRLLLQASRQFTRTRS